MAVHLAHVSITARDADRLAGFYGAVFGFERARPPKTLSGAAVSQGNGLPGCELYSIWLALPGQETPFLELLQYGAAAVPEPPGVADVGLRHLAFRTDDIAETTRRILAHGGAAVGEIANFGTEDRPFLIVYMRDCEGNILEIEEPPG